MASELIHRAQLRNALNSAASRRGISLQNQARARFVDAFNRHICLLEQFC